MKNEHLNLYNINIKYIRNLSQADDKVLSCSPQEGKESRPLVGIIVICGKKEYCIPLSSPKPKHEKMKNDKDFSRIIGSDGKLLGVLNFNLMIPVNRTLISVVDLHVYKSDSKKTAEYKHLMNDQLDWCNDNIDNIIKKANKLYQFVTLTPEKSYSLTHRCCDFKKLESVLDKWIEKELNKCNDILKANPELKAKLNAAAARYLKAHNLTPLASSATAEERYEFRLKVLQANPTLMEEYKTAEKKISQTPTVQTAPKTKHRR